MLVTGAPTDLDIARLRHEKVLDGLSTSTEPRRRRRKKAPVSSRNQVFAAHKSRISASNTRSVPRSPRPHGLAPIDPGLLGPEPVVRFGEDNLRRPA
jgi:hypothetical protein